MRATPAAWLAIWLVGLAVTLGPTTAEACYYLKRRWIYLPNPGWENTPGCRSEGWNTGTGPCPYLLDIAEDKHSCDTDTLLQSTVNYAGNNYCPCDPAFTGIPGPDTAYTYPDGSINPQAFYCEPGTVYCCDNCGPQAEEPEPELCDGTDPDNTPPFDEGCYGDEQGCEAGDGDGAPVRFSSGRVELNPITAFSVPAPDDMFFGLRLHWGSHVMRTAAKAGVQVPGAPGADTIPTIHHKDEATHFFGRGWMDNFSDRLYITTHNKQGTNTIAWQSANGTVTFTQNGAVWKSWSAKYELIDRGPNPADGLGRWVVRTTDTTAPRRIWAFEEFTYTSYGGTDYVYRLGRLRRHARLTSDLGSLTGSYGFTVDWATNGTIVRALDSFGRELSFVYESTPPVGGITYSITLSGVRYKPNAAASAVDVVDLGVSGGSLLERVQRIGAAGYTRFLYWQVPTGQTCMNCGSLVTDVVIAGGDAVSTPMEFAPVMSTEIALEHNDYGPGPAGNSNMVGIRSKYPGREYAYEWLPTATTQFDLHQDGGVCGGPGCTTGYACRASDNHCYVANVITHDEATRQQTSFSQVGGGGPNDSTRSYDSQGAPSETTNSAGVPTTYGFDSHGRIRCTVRNDDDGEAFTTPSQPDTSTCAGPAGSQIIQVDYGTGAGGCAGPTITTTTASFLSTTTTKTECLDPTTLFTTSRIRTGFTKNIDGTLLSETHTGSTTYDAFGRMTETNGPLTDSSALDKTTVTYHAYDAAWPYNVGHVASVTSYVGTSSSNTPLTTLYAEYDLFGVPHLVTSPNGDKVRYTPSADRLTWTIEEIGSTGATIGTSTVSLNADGTVRSSVDADGICMTFEYTQGTDYVGMPTKLRRSSSTSSCGVVPINENSGEVEIRTYVAGEHDRLQSITRKMNGMTQFTYSGFTYDQFRRVTATSTLDSASSYTHSFTNALPTGVTAPEGPGSGTWKSTTQPDVFDRPSSLSRFLDATNKQTYTYSYSSSLGAPLPFSARPTQLTRGYNGSETSVTKFVYDDFGRLVETTVPEAGVPGAPAPTRYEYDVADRMVKKRVGVTTPLVRTSQYTYDSLGRTTFVDHDTEHPVDCATAPEGTPIQDEEYKYDTCPVPDVPTGFACTNALGKRTVARAVLQCGTGQTVKRGRWYDYDAAGRVARVAYATVTGSTIGTPAIMTYSYTAAGRMSQYVSPLSTAFGTKYTFGAADGRASEVRTTAGSNDLLANAISYRAFGPLTNLSTAVLQPVSGGFRKLTLAATYRSDDSLSLIDWTLKHQSGGSSIAVLKQTMGYTPASLVKTRTDEADIAASRYYQYDALLRLTCEARGFDSTQPSSADCVTSSTRLASLLTYHEGASAGAPPDVRASTYIQSQGLNLTSACSTTLSNRCYRSPSLETPTYSSGSGQVTGITRTGSSLVTGYDSIGRRTFEYDSFDVIGSRRDYTYLPNGQLGTISGQRAVSHHAYTYTMRYDEKGRPLTISDFLTQFGQQQDTYELFWDDADRLIAVQITPGGSGHGGKPPIRWHYHYLGGTLLAATRELSAADFCCSSIYPPVATYWAVTDERGLIHSFYDFQGALYWRARWDASGWRAYVGTPQPEIWVPFGLPGQVVLGTTRIYPGSTRDATEAIAMNGTNIAWFRPPIALNQWRAYDPLLGAFLQPDGADHEGRTDPEGYVYARHRPTNMIDPTGRQAYWWNGSLLQHRAFDTCTPDHAWKLNNAISAAVKAVDECSFGWCGPGNVSGEDFKRMWKWYLRKADYLCYYKGQTYRDIEGDLWWIDTSSGKYFSGHWVQRTHTPPFLAIDNAFTEPYVDLSVHVSEGAFSECLKQVIAHEAWHLLTTRVDAQDYYLGTLSAPSGTKEWSPPKVRHSDKGRDILDDGGFTTNEQIEAEAKKYEQCVTCP